MPEPSPGQTPSPRPPRRVGGALEVFLVAGRLGVTSFGGPIAHLGYFRDEYVGRRKWLDEETYADLVALSQFLPGPASSQVGIAIGVQRAGLLGGLAAWIGFTLPSAIALVLFAYGVSSINGTTGAEWLHGLKIVAVAVVALAVWGMARALCPDRPRATIAILAAIGVLAWQSAGAQVAIIAAAGVLGWQIYSERQPVTAARRQFPVRPMTGAICLILFGALLIALPVAASIASSQRLSIFDSFYRAGSLVWGGGHVILPLLQAEVVPNGWVTNDQFVTGYGAAQAVPGPLTTFSAYLGASMDAFPFRWLGGLFALGAIFLPAGLLIVGALPFWDRLRRVTAFRAALLGVGAGVAGLLAAALYDPIWTSSITAPKDFALGLAAFGALAFWKLPPWLVVVGCALIAQGIGSL